MVDIKREDITLSDWTRGISADEFAWGSYFFSDWIQSGYDTKWFKLWPYVNASILNERSTGYPVCVCPSIWDLSATTTKWFVAFTYDGRMEMPWSFNGSSYWEWGEHWWGAIFSEQWSSPHYWGGIVYWDYAIGIKTDWDISKVDIRHIYDIENWQGISNHNFDSLWAWWTIWTWWSILLRGAQHITGNTGTLETTATAHWSGKIRLAIKIWWCTAGKVTLDCNSLSRSVEAKKNWWFVFQMWTATDESTYTVTITPTSDFNWYIEVVDFYVFDSNYFSTISGLASANRYQTLVWQGDIYFWYGSKINTLSTVDRTIWTEKSLIDNNETIVALTQQAWSLIIWATDGMNGKQYYWDGVSNIASEVIEWKWQTIKGVVGTETVAYVLSSAQTTADAAAFRVYAVNWYQRSLIASNSYNVQWVVSNMNRYHKHKKFVFNDVDWPQSMCMYLDNLYIPWCDGVYQFGQNIPWLKQAWSRPIKYPFGSDLIFLLQSWDIWMTYRYDKKQYYAKVQSNYCTYTGYLVTESIYRDKLSTRKAIEKLKIWYKSLASADGNIKIYAIVDDDYFRRFDVTWVTNRPEVWDIYEVADDTTAEIIRIEKTSATAWIISFRTVSNGWSIYKAENPITRVSWSGDASISTWNSYDNMILVKTIETDKQEYGSDLIFGKDFVKSYMPYWHKLQLVIELNKTDNYDSDVSNRYRTPEIYEISMVADITDTTL